MRILSGMLVNSNGSLLHIAYAMEVDLSRRSVLMAKNLLNCGDRNVVAVHNRCAGMSHRVKSEVPDPRLRTERLHEFLSVRVRAGLGLRSFPTVIRMPEDIWHPSVACMIPSA